MLEAPEDNEQAPVAKKRKSESASAPAYDGSKKPSEIESLKSKFLKKKK